MILEIIRQLGVKGGVGYAYEYGGAVVDRMSMDERMTMCNMSIEGGARVGYVNPDETTAAYPRRAAVRAAGRGVRPGQGVVARAWRPTPTRATTIASPSTAARSSRS